MERVILFDGARRQWLRCEEPTHLVVARSVPEVWTSLQRVEELVEGEGLFAAGFISYEAAPAFDDALRVRDADPSFPLLWFALFETSEVMSLPVPDLIATPDWQANISREEYRDAISTIKKHIDEGDTYQVNFSFRLRSTRTGDPFGLFCRLAAAQPSCNAAFIETDDFAICSASPELFFRLDGGNITARPMKGTSARGLTLTADKVKADALHNSKKNRAENLMIVDMMRNDLGRIATTGTVRVTSLFDVEKYPTVWQMTSTVTAETQAFVTEIMKALFPCASVTGAPKPRTMEIIAELETSPRKVYTGAIGFLAPHRRAQFNVAIRTVLIDKKAGGAEYGVGGGVVWASTAEGEYGECLAKANVLTEWRPPIRLFETLLFTRPEGFFLLEEHLARLKDSCEYFDLQCSMEAMRDILDETRKNLQGTAWRVRLEYDAHGPTVRTERLDPSSAGAPVRVRMAMGPVDPGNLFLYHKTTFRSVYEDALAAVPECDDVLLWNQRGELTESTIANIVVEMDGERYTPPVACGLLAGTFRAKLLKEGKVRERIVRKEDLRNATALFLVNSVRKWRRAILVE